MAKYIQLFCFHVQASSEGIDYKIGAKCTISEDNYRNLLLGNVMGNMGIEYQSEDYQKFKIISAAIKKSKRYKVGRFVTQFEEISDSEIKNVLRYLGCDLASIYLKENELNFLEQFYNPEEETGEDVFQEE